MVKGNLHRNLKRKLAFWPMWTKHVMLYLNLQKVFFLRRQIFWLKILQRRFGLKCHKKTCKNLKNFVKLCQFIFLNAWFSYFAFKSTHCVLILENFAQACVCTSATLRRSCSTRPSKCPKFYTAMISSEKNLRQKTRKF